MKRNYDRESGMNRIAPSNPEDPETELARLSIVEKPYMDDKQRPIFDKTETSQTRTQEVTKHLEPRTNRDTEQNQKSAKTAHFKVAPQYALLTAFDIFGIARPTLKVLNEFVPSTFELFNLLHGMHSALVGNNKIQNYFVDYFTLASRIYYGYMAVYQILRCRLASGRPLAPIHRRVFKKLETTLPLESCPIASPLLGWFQNLGAHHLSDACYDWIVPVLPDITPATPLAAPTGDMFHFPPLPAMIAFFRTLANAGENAPSFQNEQGYIIPVNAQAADPQQFLGQVWTVNPAVNFPLALTSTFARPGLSFPLAESADYMSRTRRTYWKRLNLPDINADTPTASWETFLMMEGNANLDWLRSIRNYAIAESRFFKGSANLAQISPVSGLNVTVIGQSFHAAAAPAALRPYETAYSGYDQVPTSYHALSSLIEDVEFRFGGTHRLIICPTAETTFQVPATFPVPTQTLTGPFFRDPDANEAFLGPLRNRWHLETSTAKEMFSDVRALILAHLYEPKGVDPESIRLV